MSRFTYIARSGAGERVEGSVEAPDKRSALLQIERMGCMPFSVVESVGAAAQIAAPEKKKLFTVGRGTRAPRMTLREALLFTRELGDLISSGMTLGNALNTLSRRKTKKGQDQIVAEIRDEILQGSTLSDALSRFPQTFSHLYVSMVRAGEASGALHEALVSLSKHYERVQEAREKVLMAMIYPIFVLSVGTLTMIFTMIFVVPRFSQIFEDLGSTLPLPTLILINSSSFLLHYGWLLAILVVLGIWLLKRALKTPVGLRRFHRLELRIPFIRQIITANAYAQFARTLGALLANGVPVLQALSIVEDTIGNVVIAEEIEEARNRVTDGSTISGPLAAGKVFPPLLTDMLAVGEETGDMSGALAHIAKRYDDELDRSVKIFTTVLEPLMIVIMAVLVGFIAISMLMAVFDLTTGLNVK